MLGAVEKWQIKDTAHKGGFIKCEKEEYLSWVRDYLVKLEKEFKNADQDLKAALTLAERKRLDKKFKL